MGMDFKVRFRNRVLAACGLALLFVSGGWAAPSSHHRIDATTRASIDRQAPKLLKEKGVTHVGYYGFTIDRKGHVLDAWVVRSAGVARLDRMALAMIRKAVLKRRPAHAPARLQFVVPIEFHKNGTAGTPNAR